MGTPHGVACDRRDVLKEVSKHINLSINEMKFFIEAEVGDNLACNCGRGLTEAGWRDRRVRERLVTDAVLKARGLRAREAMQQQGKAKVVRAMKEKSGQEAQIIRIDFEKRRRIDE